MSITLPNASTANADSVAATAAATTAAEAAFVANATVLINDAMALGLFKIEPFMIPLVTSDYIATYFQALGYVVLFPIVPVDPFNPSFIAGFPEVLPPGYVIPGNGDNDLGPPRIRISWGP
jgi:hypothetical protein